MHAERPHAVRVRTGYDADPHQRGDDGRGDGARQAGDLIRGAGTYRSAACHYNRALGLPDEPDGIRYAGEVLCRFFDAVMLLGERLIDISVDLVDRQVDMDRPGPSGAGDLPCLIDSMRQPVDVRDPEIVLGDGHHERIGIDLLECLGSQDLRAHLASEGDHRNGVCIGCGDPGEHVGGSRPGGGEAYARLPGCTGIAVGGVAGALLVPDQDMPDRRFPYLVVNGDDGTSRISEHRPDASVLQHFEQSSGAFHANRSVIALDYK